MTGGQTGISRYQTYCERADPRTRIKLKGFTVLEDEPHIHRAAEKIRELRGSRYDLVGQIAEGGMGYVFLAHDTTRDCPVAIKTIKPEFAQSPEHMSRFIAEGQLPMKVQSDAIVQVVDIGEIKKTRGGREETVDGFIVMELYSGSTLTDLNEKRRAEGNPLTEKEICTIGAKVARGLQACHEVGIVHRDIKTDNIRVMESADGIRVKILDFGVAKDHEKRGVEHTRVGTPMGTIGFMPPEQALGETGINGKVDSFALGVVLHAMIENDLPYTQSDADGAFQYAIRIRSEKPKEIQALVNTRLKEIILRCLNTQKPELRPTMEEIAQELESISGNGFGGRESRLPAVEISGNGRYTIGAKILTRDTGNIYEGYTQTGKRVAIKEITADTATQMRERAEDELRTVREINHPNVARVLEIIKTERSDGSIYIVYDMSPTANLTEIDFEKKTDLEKLELAIQIAKGLKAIHGKEIIHRDIRPASVFLEGEEASGVKIVNFAYAKRESITKGRTIAGSAVGTEHAYISPEQMSGEAVDSKTDIYSLGVILNEMFYGVRPADLRVETREPQTQKTEIKKLIKECLNSAKKRPTAEELTARLEQIKAKIILDTDAEERTIERPAFNPAATQQGYGVGQVPQAPYAVPVTPLFAPVEPVVVATPAPVAPPRDSPIPEIGPQDRAVAFEIPMKPNPVKKAGLIIAGIIAVGMGVAAVGVKISKSRSRPNEPRNETIMRDASPEVVVPTQIPVDAPAVEQDAGLPQVTIPEDASVEATSDASQGEDSGRRRRRRRRHEGLDGL